MRIMAILAYYGPTYHGATCRLPGARAVDLGRRALGTAGPARRGHHPQHYLLLTTYYLLLTMAVRQATSTVVHGLGCGFLCLSVCLHHLLWLSYLLWPYSPGDHPQHYLLWHYLPWHYLLWPYSPGDHPQHYSLLTMAQLNMALLTMALLTLALLTMALLAR